MTKTADSSILHSHAQSWAIADLPGVSCFSTVASRHTFDWHTHEEYGFGVIEEGVFGLDYWKTKQVIPPKNILVFNPGDAHTGYPIDEQPLSYRMVYVTEGWLQQVFEDDTRLPHFQQVCFDNPPLARQIYHLHCLLESASDQLECSEALIMTLRALIAATSSFAPPRPLRPSPEPVAIKRIKDFLHEYQDQKISIDDLVRLTQFHRAYLIRMFRQHVGISPYTYLLQLRVESAKKLLAQGMPIAEVALAVGFADQSHFTNRFKRITGITPYQFRRGHYHTRRCVSISLP